MQFNRSSKENSVIAPSGSGFLAVFILEGERYVRYERCNIVQSILKLQFYVVRGKGVKQRHKED
ncbi:hypothetical protein ABNX05_02030 [Lysinibacillus sp. M3]|uniref:Uncharacterized protein n=1 Tax=Lysinibacillus zambalensis TaxID=3160866 RepID=A0ABV1MLK0_9BACI